MSRSILPKEISVEKLTSIKNSTNLLPINDFHVILQEVLFDISTILSSHCGPYGKFAVLTDLNNIAAEPVFTKDGINIIRALEYKDPIKQMIKKMIAYVGSRVEALAGDGTTSAMILFTNILHSLIMKSRTESTPYSYNAYMRIMDEVIMPIIRGTYQTYVVTVDDLEKYLEAQRPSSIESFGYYRQKAIDIIAYNQAMTSSHGDVELSKAVAAMYTTVPEDSWSYMCFLRESYETKKRIETIVDLDQYTLEATVLDNRMLNHNLNTECIYDNATVLVLCHDLMKDDARRYKDVEYLIDSYLNPEKYPEMVKINQPLVIVAPTGLDYATKDDILKKLKGRSDAKIAVFTHTYDNPKANDLIGLSFVMGIQPLMTNTMPTVVCRGVDDKGVSIAYKDHTLKFNNLYVKNEGPYHPKLDDPNCQMKVFLDSLSNGIVNMKQNTITRSLSKEITFLEKLYNKVKFVKKAMVKIGGSAHDNAASVDVIMDTVTAVRTSLTHGVVPCACIALQQTLLRIQSEQNTKSDTPSDVKIGSILDTYIFAVLEGLKELESSIVNYAPTNGASEIDSFFDTSHKLSTIRESFLSYLIFQKDADGYAAVQSSNVDIAILERINEVAIKLLYADSLVIMNPSIGDHNAH